MTSLWDLASQPGAFPVPHPGILLPLVLLQCGQDTPSPSRSPSTALNGTSWPERWERF